MKSLFSEEEVKNATETSPAVNPYWKANTAGDLIEGLYLGQKVCTSGSGDTFDVIIVDAAGAITEGVKEDGGRMDVSLTTVLRQYFDENVPIPGKTWVRIQYTGTETSKNGRDYKTFAVMSKEAPEELQQVVAAPVTEVSAETITEEDFDDDIPF